jgi:hypothetical protein
MVIRVFNPVGEVAPTQFSAMTRMHEPRGARLGLVFNHHPACLELWTQLERALELSLVPKASHRITKSNISVPQPEAQLAALATQVDYVLVGVGA